MNNYFPKNKCKHLYCKELFLSKLTSHDKCVTSRGLRHFQALDRYQFVLQSMNKNPGKMTTLKR